MRLAFVGQSTYFHYCALEEPAGGLEPSFVDFRAGDDPGALAAGLRRIDPDVIFSFRPEIVPAGALHGMRALRIGLFTEPIARPGGVDHPDLRERAGESAMVDSGNFDRLASFDPLIVPTLEQFCRVWRCFPIPVSDRYFGDVAPPRVRRRVLFTGRHTDHREALLRQAKHAFDVDHLAFGVNDDRLITFLRDSDVGINLHNEPYPTFENRVCVYLAAGLLLVSEPLSPPHGLTPGVDFLEVETADDLLNALTAFDEAPEAFRPLRLSGRRKAERWRASNVYPRIVRDLIADVELFGRG
jgi:hypothetical protein